MTSDSFTRDVLEAKVLAPLRASILLSPPERYSTSTKEFGSYFTKGVAIATSTFCSHMGVVDLIELSRGRRVTFFYRILSAMNGVLGKACPYIAALVYFRKEGSIQVGAILRASLPTGTPVSDDIVPFLDYQSESDIDEGRDGALRLLASEDEFAGLFEPSDTPQDL